MERSVSIPKANKRSCGTCEFALANARPKAPAPAGAAGIAAVDLSQPQSFQCRRFPPQFSVAINERGAPMALWPNLIAEHWCGEWREDETRTAALLSRGTPVA